MQDYMGFPSNSFFFSFVVYRYITFCIFQPDLKKSSMRYFPQLNEKQMKFQIECFAEINEKPQQPFHLLGSLHFCH